MRYQHLVVRAVLAATLSALPLSAWAENIDPDDEDLQLAWSENAGWINAEPSGDGGPGLQVGDFDVTGWMWGENIGWISLSCKNRSSCEAVSYGIRNDGLGNLEGDAWSENAGWIRFSHTQGNVWIDPVDGLFYGYAWGENVGWVAMSSGGGPVPFGIRTGWTCAPPPPVPPHSTQLMLDRTGGGEALLTWPAVADATGYDVIKGNLNILRDPGGGFAPAVLGCVGENVTETSALAPEPPPLDIGFWYLVRGVNCGGTGTYDSGGAGQAWSRDGDLEASGMGCRAP